MIGRCNTDLGVLRLSTELLRSAIADSYSGVESRLADAVGVNRSTLNRWLNGALPKTSELTLRLAQALDVDPFALWDLAPDTYPRLCQSLAHALIWRRGSHPHPALTSLKDMIMPAERWPPSSVVKVGARRSWAHRDFLHDRTQRNTYAAVHLSPRARRSRPLVWHFAYRDTGGLPSPIWHPYGFVKMANTSAWLFTFNGLTGETSGVGDALRVDTWFGEGAAEFRVASLHEFTLEVSVPAVDVTGPRLRFGFA